MIYKISYIQTPLIFLLMIYIQPVHAAPQISFLQNMEVIPGRTIDIPVRLLEPSSEIGGYLLRIVYDETILKNPVIIDTGTLSQSHPDLISKISHDGTGIISIGIGFDFSASQDGILIIIRFDISPDFCGTTDIRFIEINRKTALFTSGFEIIEAEFINGSLLSVLCDVQVTEPEPEFETEIKPIVQPQKPPAVALTSTSPYETDTIPIPVKITFDTSVYNFESSNLIVSNGKIEDFSGFGAEYFCNIIPLESGIVELIVKADAAFNENGTGNIESEPMNLTYHAPEPETSWPQWDFNKDGIVNFIDLGLMADQRGILCDDTKWNDIYDLKSDCIIDELDLNILHNHWLEATTERSPN